MAIKEEIHWWWLMLIQLILMGLSGILHLWVFFRFFAKPANSVRSLQWATTDSSFGLRRSFTEIWLHDELVQGVKPKKAQFFAVLAFCSLNSLNQAGTSICRIEAGEECWQGEGGSRIAFSTEAKPSIHLAAVWDSIFRMGLHSWLKLLSFWLLEERNPTAFLVSTLLKQTLLKIACLHM